jgi:arabinofuranosyltransferase
MKHLSERWRWAIILGLPLLGAGLYLTCSWVRGGTTGFPLDDAWIHQTFARSLAERGELTFNPGEPSAGLTAPLWTCLLAVGHHLDAVRAWSYALGVGMLMMCGWLTWRLARRLFPKQPEVAWIATPTVLLEWHLAWAAVSGMETLLFMALSLGLIEVHLATRDHSKAIHSVALGLLSGLLFLTRPEGVLLAGLIGLDLLASRRWRDATLLGAACLSVASPWLWHNWQITGGLLPDTFAAKSAYTTGAGLFGRLAFLLFAIIAFWASSLLLLLPVAPWAAWRSLHSDRTVHWLPLVWPLSLLALYTWRLPVLYHHARYLMPILPWIALYGARGLLSLPGRQRQKFLLALSGLVSLVFWFQGANIYAWNVDNIEKQQVLLGRWLAQFTPADAIVAANDVGAVGYFGRRRVIDLEGLITPEINRLNRTGASLVPYLRDQNVAYMVLYQDLQRPWLDAVTLVPLFAAELDYVTISASARMTVYQVSWSEP